MGGSAIFFPAPEPFEVKYGMCITLCITADLYSVLNRHHHLRWYGVCITHTVNLYSGLNQHHLRRNMECFLQCICVLSCHLQWHMMVRALQCVLQCVYVLPWHSIIWGEKMQCECITVHLCSVLPFDVKYIECPLQYIYVLSWRSTIRGEVLYQWRVQRMYSRPTAYRRPAQRDCL